MTEPEEPPPEDEVGGHVHRREDATTGQLLPASIDRVWAALVDPRTYPLWLVGAKRIRRVEEDWPAVGSAFHHTVGVAPLLLKDRTVVLEIDEPHLLALEAHVSVLGTAAVTFQLTEEGPDATRVAIAERPATGPMRRVWRLGGRAAMVLGLWGRNQESLRALGEGLERGTIGPVGGSPR